MRHQIFPENLARDIRTISFALSQMFRLFSFYARDVIIYDASNFEIARYVDEKHHRHLSKVGYVSGPRKSFILNAIFQGFSFESLLNMHIKIV